MHNCLLLLSNYNREEYFFYLSVVVINYVCIKLGWNPNPSFETKIENKTTNIEWLWQKAIYNIAMFLRSFSSTLNQSGLMSQPELEAVWDQKQKPVLKTS